MTFSDPQHRHLGQAHRPANPHRNRTQMCTSFAHDETGPQ